MLDAAYPESTGRPFYSKWASGVLKFFRRSDASEFMAYDGTNRRTIIAGVPISKRVRVAIANVNAGAVLLPALPGYALRLIDCTAIAIGGAVGAVTTVDVLGTQGAAGVKLVSFAQANLTRSTPLYPGITGAAVLADGASFAANDAGAAITVGITGANATTATHIDFLLTYVID